MFKEFEEIEDIKYSPDGKFLACGSRDNYIHIFDTNNHVPSKDMTKPARRRYKRIGICRGHSSYVTHIDWTANSKMLQSNDGAYELLYWEPENVTEKGIVHQYTHTMHMRQCTWYTWTAVLGWPVMGIFPAYSDGTDVNSVDRSNRRDLIVTGDDNFKVNLMRFPALKGPNGELTERKEYGGHCSHIMGVKFLATDAHVISIGGNDCSIFQWVHKEKNPAWEGNDPKFQGETKGTVLPHEDRTAGIDVQKHEWRQVYMPDDHLKLQQEYEARICFEQKLADEESDNDDEEDMAAIRRKVLGPSQAELTAAMVDEPFEESPKAKRKADKARKRQAAAEERKRREREREEARARKKEEEKEAAAQKQQEEEDVDDEEEKSSSAGFTSAQGNPSRFLCKAKALFDYEKEDDEEINMKKGEILGITEKDEDWWTAVNSKGEEGLVPENYIEVI